MHLSSGCRSEGRQRRRAARCCVLVFPDVWCSHAPTRRASGGIGRRARFRSVCPRGRGGSTPPSRTHQYGTCPRPTVAFFSPQPELCTQLSARNRQHAAGAAATTVGRIAVGRGALAVYAHPVLVEHRDLDTADRTVDFRGRSHRLIRRTKSTSHARRPLPHALGNSEPWARSGPEQPPQTAALHDLATIGSRDPVRQPCERKVTSSPGGTSQSGLQRGTGKPVNAWRTGPRRHVLLSPEHDLYVGLPPPLVRK